jgi:putative hydrolase of the HAD superfamily
MFDLIAFDGDDTLWQNEPLYHNAQEQFRDLLAGYAVDDLADARLYETEMRNLRLFGYGAKAFTLSMIETAIELTDGRIVGSDVQRIIDAVKYMLQRDIQLLDHVQETIPRLAGQAPLMIVTKGDPLDQESKIARSGLADYFEHVEIVSSKDEDTYAAILRRYGVPPERFLMIGNSLPSDVLPVVALGGQAVHIPHETTWAHEMVTERPGATYVELEHVGQIPGWLAGLNGR